MDRHIDLDSAMINHLEGLGYKVTKPTDSIGDEDHDGLPALLQLALKRHKQADTKYEDAWDCLGFTTLAEIIMMKANRVIAGVENEDMDVVEDSLVDIVNYACKLYIDYVTREDD